MGDLWNKKKAPVRGLEISVFRLGCPFLYQSSQQSEQLLRQFLDFLIVDNVRNENGRSHVF